MRTGCTKSTNPVPHVGEPCNDAVTSIMDVEHVVSGTVTHCDDLSGPSSWDAARVRDFYRDGGLVDFTSMAESDTVGIFKWKDDAWGESRHEFSYRYRLDGDDPDDSWVIYHRDGSFINRIGRHKDIAPDPDTGIREVIEFTHRVDLTVHTSRHAATYPLPPRSAYTVCARAYYIQADHYSHMQCAPERSLLGAFELHRRRVWGGNRHRRVVGELRRLPVGRYDHHSGEHGDGDTYPDADRNGDTYTHACGHRRSHRIQVVDASRPDRGRKGGERGPVGHGPAVRDQRPLQPVEYAMPVPLRWRDPLGEVHSPRVHHPDSVLVRERVR